jgi:hypothetical protein
MENVPSVPVFPSGKGKIYGNWCGGDWTGGRKEQYDPRHDHDFYYAVPDDKLDDACRTHDIRYYECRQAYKCNKAGRIACMRTANYMLAEDAGASGVKNRQASEIIVAMDNMPDWYIASQLAGDDDPSCSCKK